jgi:hypothetical protein
MVTYASFVVKYPQFESVLETQFNFLLADAIADMNQYNWQALGVGWESIKDRAIETLIACQLSQTNQEFLPVRSFEVRESAYKVDYADSDKVTIGSSWYCSEHQRLIDRIEQLNKNKTTLPSQTQGICKRVYW